MHCVELTAEEARILDRWRRNNDEGVLIRERPEGRELIFGSRIRNFFRQVVLLIKWTLYTLFACAVAAILFCITAFFFAIYNSVGNILGLLGIFRKRKS